MNQYDILAQNYEALRLDRFSLGLAPKILELIPRYRDSAVTWIDLACGTGSAAMAFARAGYEVTGIDNSRGMLKVARSKVPRRFGNPQFIEQDICTLRIKNQFDIATCLFDAINHFIKPKDFRAVLRNTFRLLKPGGLFIFDFNTDAGLRRTWNQPGVRIEGTAMQIWQSRYDESTRIATVTVTVFRPALRKLYEKMQVTVPERGFTISEMTAELEHVGFAVLATLDSMTLQKAKKNCGRVLMVARKE